MQGLYSSPQQYRHFERQSVHGEATGLYEILCLSATATKHENGLEIELVATAETATIIVHPLEPSAHVLPHR